MSNVQPVVIHGSLAGPACRPSAHLAGCRNIKESFLSLAGSACRLGGDIRADIGLYARPKNQFLSHEKDRRLHAVWLVQPVDQLHTWWLAGAACRDVLKLFSVFSTAAVGLSGKSSLQLAAPQQW